eukprot:1033020-Rhodomonas_salina.1
MYPEFNTWNCLGAQLRELAQSGEPHIVTLKSQGEINVWVPRNVYAGLEMAAFVSGYKKCPDNQRRPDERVPDVKAFLEAISNCEFFEGLCVEDVEPGKFDGHLGD